MEAAETDLPDEITKTWRGVWPKKTPPQKKAEFRPKRHLQYPPLKQYLTQGWHTPAEGCMQDCKSLLLERCNCRLGAWDITDRTVRGWTLLLIK